MAKQHPDNIQIIATNKKAKFEYKFVDEYEAGIRLFGTEIKSIRKGLINMGDAFCHFKDGELYIHKLYIGEYSHGTYYNHEPLRLRKLLLKKGELKKIERKAREKGYSIVPYQLYITERGFAKLLIVLATGKKNYDKRHSIKDRENKRNLDRAKKGGDY